MGNVILQAWNKTTKLLLKEVKKHFRKYKLIDSWKFAGDSFKIDRKALAVYHKQVSQSKLSMVINLVHKKESLWWTVSPRYSQYLALNELKIIMNFLLGTLKQKQLQKSMRPNCINQMLLQLLSDAEQSLLSYYFKAIQHFYLPLSCF
ncbi:hypothetical protein NIES267_64850 [Calothrix parasitica NIES-267]|uniref:Uncharacterized protein n=1 Tax=Calothrix parasitica NIES-267 TaxID=1973488 RepID=A0A1Z4M0F0_9CYAN|nr:hypothetical protein NIES267_64850 [Calothrix parasitica NIES-267]